MNRQKPISFALEDFFFACFLGTPAWFWLAFLGLIFALTAFDLGVLRREDRDMGIGESLKLSAFYICVALLFGIWVWYARGPVPGMQYFTGFFIEKALSIDNVFVISLIFTYFTIPAKYHRALLWGILAVIVLRGLMIAGGAGGRGLLGSLPLRGIPDLHRRENVLRGDEPMDVANNPVVRFISRHMPVTQELHGQRFSCACRTKRRASRSLQPRRCSLRLS